MAVNFEQRQKDLAALEKAKANEKKLLKDGAKYQKIDTKAFALKR